MTACLTPQGETNSINRFSIKLPLNYEYHIPSALHFFLGCPIIHSHLPNLQSCLSLQCVQQVRVLTSTTLHIFTESCRVYFLNTLYDMTFPGPIGIALVNCYSPRLLSLLLNRGFSPSGFSRRCLWPLLRQQSPHCIHQLMHLHCPQKTSFLQAQNMFCSKWVAWCLAHDKLPKSNMLQKCVHHYIYLHTFRSRLYLYKCPKHGVDHRVRNSSRH